MGRICLYVLSVRTTMITRVAFFTACASFALLQTSNAITKNYLSKVVAAKVKCQEKFAVPEDTVEDFMKKNIKPDSHDAKCMAACVLEERGMMKDGKVVMEEVLLDNREKWLDPDDVAKGDQVAQKCFQEIPAEVDDTCDMGVDFLLCCVKGIEEMALPQVDFANPTDR